MKEMPLRKSDRNVNKTKVTYYSGENDREDLTSDSGDDPIYEDNSSSMSEEEISGSSRRVAALIQNLRKVSQVLTANKHHSRNLKLG